MAGMAKDDRGQVLTIEALIAAIILLVVLAVVVQATSVTPLTTSFTNQHVKYELQSMAQDILTSLDEMPYDTPIPSSANSRSDTMPSKLENSIRDWLEGSYYEYTPTPIPTPTAIPHDWYTFDGIDSFQSKIEPSIARDMDTESTEFEKALNFAFSESGIAYNVEVRYPDEFGKVNCAKMIWNGDPSDNCVTISRYVALHNPNPGGPPYSPVEESTAIFSNDLIGDISPATTLHNVVEVRLTVWVM